MYVEVGVGVRVRVRARFRLLGCQVVRVRVYISGLLILHYHMVRCTCSFNDTGMGGR